MTSNTPQLGAGLNPALLDNKLVLPEKVNFIEFGLDEYERVICFYDERIKKSLHIARSPILEENTKQIKFIKNLSHSLKTLVLESVGFHLTGARNSGIGRYGFSSHYDDSLEKRERAIRFIKFSQDILQVPIWVENANFYSHSFDEVKKNLEAISTISYLTNSQIILDLTHLYIDCRNVGGKILDIINYLPWSCISEIHLSGMRLGKNGILHDAHNEPIQDEIWSLFQVLYENHIHHLSCYVTVEHTDIKWASNSATYYNDFVKLSKILEKKYIGIPNTSTKCPELYAKNYLHRILEIKNKSLKDYLEKRNVNFHLLAEEWITYVINNTDKYIVLNYHDMLDEDNEAILLQNNFHDFVRTKAKCYWA